MFSTFDASPVGRLPTLWPLPGLPLLRRRRSENPGGLYEEGFTTGMSNSYRSATLPPKLSSEPPCGFPRRNVPGFYRTWGPIRPGWPRRSTVSPNQYGPPLRQRATRLRVVRHPRWRRRGLHVAPQCLRSAPRQLSQRIPACRSVRRKYPGQPAWEARIRWEA
jgi:hypothetical protein